MTSVIGRKASHRLLQGFLLAVLVVAGVWVRTLPSRSPARSFFQRQLWKRAPVATLYFTAGRHLFPISRRLAENHDFAHETLEALLAGPSASSGLTSPIARGTKIRSLELAGGAARVDLSRAFLEPGGETGTARMAIVETMTALPDVDSVSLSVEGEPIAAPTKRVPLLYYASANGLAAETDPANTPRSAVYAYLAGPSALELTGLPPDIRLLNYNYGARDGLLSLNFSYTPSVRSLAVDHPERMRMALLGLIASLTEFAEVRAVQLSFEGRARLGLGQCSDLLGTPQPRPALLNDERLVGLNVTSPPRSATP